MAAGAPTLPHTGTTGAGQDLERSSAVAGRHRVLAALPRHPLTPHLPLLSACPWSSERRLQSTTATDRRVATGASCGLSQRTNNRLGQPCWASDLRALRSNFPKRGQPMSDRMGDGVTKAVSARVVEDEGVILGLTTRE